MVCHCNKPVTKRALEDEFPECSDPYDKTLDRLRRDKLEGVLKLYGLIQKKQGIVTMYLKESPFLREKPGAEPQPLLLCRDIYYADYEKILNDCAPKTDNGKDRPSGSILQQWIDECAVIKRYDERCIMLLERLGFLPAFGKKEEKRRFLAKAKELIYRFDAADAEEYGGTELLIFARSVILGAIEYIEAQLQIILTESDNASLQRQFAHLLQRLRTIRVPEQFALNPLLCVVYYDYLGLTYYRNYLNLHTEEYLLSATQATKTALEYAQKVDMHLQIWSAFLTYNLARFLSLQGDHEPAVQNIQTAVILRQELADSPFFTKELTHDLCFEYYLARIRQTEIEQRAGLLTAEAAQSEYRQIQAETEDAYGGIDGGDSQAYLNLLLRERMQQP